MPGEYHVTKSRPASLEEETRTVIEEARMVLPGIQAVFGFQLIAVFNNGFHSLTPPEQLMHLNALVLIMIAIALIMTPASYHRIAEKGTGLKPSAGLLSPTFLLLRNIWEPWLRC